MPFYKCAVEWCQCTPISKKSCLFGLPKSERLKKKWLRFVADSRVTKDKNRKVPNTVMICNKHFPKSSFENLYQFEMGFAMRLILKSGAVPVSPEVISEDSLVAWKSYENNSGSSSAERNSTAKSNVPALKKLQISMAAPGKSNYSIPQSKSIIPKVSIPPAPSGKIHSLLSQVSDFSHSFTPGVASFSQNYDCDDENTNSEECIGVRSSISRKEVRVPNTSAKTSIGLQSDLLQITKDSAELVTSSSTTSNFSQTKAVKKKSCQFGAEDVLRYFLTGKTPPLDYVSLKQFWQYASNFRLSGQGDLLRKSSKYNVGARLKFVILSPERKQQVFDYFQIGKKNISTECQIIARYFWWPNLRDDIKKFVSDKTSAKPIKENKEPEVTTDTCSSNVSSTEGEQVSFLKGFKLKLASEKVQDKTVDTTRWDHDYTADRLTVKRMLCAKDPDSAPANKKAKKSAQDVADNAKKATLYKKIISSSEDSDCDDLSSSYSEKITRVQPETFAILPQPENFPFIRLLGLELVCNRLNRTKEPAPTVPNTCRACTTDCTVTWHKAAGGVVCHECHTEATKKALAKKRKSIDPMQYHHVKAHPSHPRPLQYLVQKKSSSLKPMVFHHVVKEIPPKANAPSKVNTNVARIDKQSSIRITMSKDHFNSINNKISLMEAANKIRDHINSRLMELKGKPKAQAKKDEPITIQQRQKPPSSVELLRSMRLSQRAKPVVLVKKVRKYNYHRTSKAT